MKSRHLRPDFLITNFHCEKIPWGAWLWHSAGLVDDEEFYNKRESFSHQVKFIVECKEDEPYRKRLISSIVVYSLASIQKASSSGIAG